MSFGTPCCHQIPQPRHGGGVGQGGMFWDSFVIIASTIIDIVIVECMVVKDNLIKMKSLVHSKLYTMEISYSFKFKMQL